MSIELSPIILGVGAWAGSFIARYSLKSSLKKQTLNRKHDFPPIYNTSRSKIIILLS